MRTLPRVPRFLFHPSTAVVLCLFMVLLVSLRSRAQTSPPPGIPDVIHEHESTVYGTWTWHSGGTDGYYNATWQEALGPAFAIITVKSFTPDSVLLDRVDTPESVSAGLTAVYKGKISSCGDSIIDGTVTWTWPGVAGYPATGTWEANWSSNSAAATSTGSPIESETLATVPGIANSRTCIGVGESVKVTGNESATWTISSKSGSAALSLYTEPTRGFPANEGFPTEECSSDGLAEEIDATDQVCFRAPSSNDTVVVSAKYSDGSSSSIVFTVLQPTGLIFRRLTWPTGSPDFFLFALGSEYRIQMESALFVTPGDVSFANLLFEERDITPPYVGRRFNALYNVSGTRAWLVNCDKDIDYHNVKNGLGQDIDPIDPKQSKWVYQDRDQQLAFSLVQTSWSRHIVGLFGDYEYTKKQFSALSRGGVFEETPNAPSSTLQLPAIPLIFYWDDIKVPNNGQECLQMVDNQFKVVP